MRARLVLPAALLLGAGCNDTTPVILRPVFHDVTLTFQTRQDDVGLPTYKYTEAFSGTLIIDFHSGGAVFDLSTTPSCLAPAGAITVTNRRVDGDFNPGNGPRLTMSGSADGEGVLSGSFSCVIRYGGSPHGPSYSGTFRATPRP